MSEIESADGAYLKSVFVFRTKQTNKHRFSTKLFSRMCASGCLVPSFRDRH